MAPRNLLDSLDEVSARLERASRVFLGLDFDGTLAPIRPTPGEVELDESVRGTIDRLSRWPGMTVAIVSGRSIADVAARVGLPGLIYAGNHGLEIEGPGLSFLEPTAAALVGPLHEVVSRLASALADVHGALVEPKGLTASVHDRNVSPEDRPAVERAVREALRGEGRFVVTDGLHVREIRPRVDWHKGRAVEQILRDLGGSADRLACYIGDDRTDEDAFAAIPEGITARVGTERATRAGYRIESPADVARFLDWLAVRVGATSP